MAQETNQTQVPLLCTTGCGFYGSPRTNGMCSVCYKEFLQRQQSSDRISPPAPSGPSSSPMAPEAVAGQRAEGDSTPEDAKASAQTPVTHQMTAMSISREETSNETEEFNKTDEASSASSSSANGSEPGASHSLTRLLLPALPCQLPRGRKGDGSIRALERGTLLEISQSTAEGKTASEKPKPKKNRCFTCRKKIGLTGFDCRCGNLFCAIHRYSDMHACPYDYKAEAAEKIRKENPIVIAEKIQKL